MTVHFDTLEFVKTLTAAGVETAHAEAMARAQARSLDEVVSAELATKADLKVQRAEIRADHDKLRAEVRADHDKLKSELGANIDTLRADIRADIAILRADLTAQFDLQFRSLRYAATLAMGFLSVVVVLARFIR